MATYPYSPLSPVRNEIRLLSLRPGEPSSIVELEISHASLDDSIEYEALSYVWGDATVCEDIHIRVEAQLQGDVSIDPSPVSHQKADMVENSIKVSSENPASPKKSSVSESDCNIYVFKATTNLQSALQHLRYLDRPRILWVDAICINQQDLIERGHQVRQMDQIYQRCTSVCIWLGASTNDSDLAIDFINRVETEMLSKGSNEDGKFNFTDTFSPVIRRFLEDEQFVPHFKALAKLIYRPWFTRLWIVQEVVLAPSKTVVCGQRTTGWGLLFRSFLFLWIEGRSPNGLGRLGRDSSGKPFDSLSQDMSGEWRKEVTKFMRLGTMAINWDNGPLPFRGLVLELRGRAMTDKRDAVYGVLSLTSDVNARNLEIDYRSTQTDVYRSAVQKEIECNGCIDIICDSPACPHDKTTSPSWLPWFDSKELSCGCNSFTGSDLTFRGTHYLKPGESLSKYNASRSRRPNVIFCEQGNDFVTNGIFVDSIRSVMQRPLWTQIPGSEPHLTIPRQWFSLAHDSQVSSDTQVSDNIDLMKFEALWRTMVGDRVPPTTERPSSMVGEALLAWLRQDSSSDLAVTPAEGYNQTKSESGFQLFKAWLYTTVGHQQTLVVTEQGRFGLAKGNVAQGDQVSVLIGCSVPVILRKTPCAQREEYTLVGESYVHGIMDGEMMSSLDAGEYELQSITIV